MSKNCTIFNQEELERLRAPIERAWTLPRRAYTSQAFYEAEVENIFRRRWIAVGHAATISAPGDALPITVCGMPVVILRNAQSEVRAFHNVTPHDRCPAVIAPVKGLSEIVGAYHGWRWDLDGRLVEATLFNGRANQGPGPVAPWKADLVPIACGIWLDLVFINLSDDPPPFGRHVAPVADHLTALDLTPLRIGIDGEGRPLQQHFGIGANWKIVFENGGPNVYHEGFVHEVYRRSDEVPRVTPAGAKRYEEVNDRGFLGMTWPWSNAGDTYGLDPFPPLRHAEGKPLERGTIACLYPNVMVSVFPDLLRTTYFLPDGPVHTDWMAATYFVADAATAPSFLDARMKAHSLFGEARIEDTRICEAVQLGCRSPAYEYGFYAPFWQSMHYAFTNCVVDDLEREWASRP